MEISMQERPQDLKSITQDELVQFILRHGIDKGSNRFYFPPRFPWKERLIEEGYHPKFEGINFATLRKALLEDGVTVGAFLTFQRSGNYKDIDFSHCTYMRKFEDAIFVNCTFNDCVFQDGFINGIMHNCTLKSVAFAKNVPCTGLQLNKVKMHDCIFEGGMLSGTKFIDTHLDHCYFNHIIFSECYFSCSSFENLDLTNTKFDRCRMVNMQVTNVQGLLTSDFYKSDMSHGIELGAKPIVVMLYSPSDGVTMAKAAPMFLSITLIPVKNLKSIY